MTLAQKARSGGQPIYGAHGRAAVPLQRLGCLLRFRAAVAPGCQQEQNVIF